MTRNKIADIIAYTLLGLIAANFISSYAVSLEINKHIKEQVKEAEKTEIKK